MTTGPGRLGMWIFRRVLRRAPRDWRDAHGLAMEQTFRSVCRDARARGGVRLAWAVALAECADLARVVTRARRDARSLAPRRPGPGLDFWRLDLRQATHSLGRRRAFTAAAVVTIGLGAGAATAMFSVIDAVVLRPLPFREPERLVEIDNQQLQGRGRYPGLGPDLLRAVADTGLFERIEAYDGKWMVLTGAGEPERLATAQITSGLLDLLGTRPRAGRGLLPGDETGGGQPVALVSPGFARARFGSIAAAVGGSLVLDGVSHLVVGVVPETFQLPSQSTRVWTPLGSGVRSRLVAIGRLAPGVTVEAAADRLGALRPAWAEAGLVAEGWGVQPRPLDEVQRDNSGRSSGGRLVLMFGVAVALLLIVACANVAGLALADAAGRGRELAIRSAIGASRGRLARLLLVESALVATAGCALGVALAAIGLDALVALAPARLVYFRAGPIGIDVRALVFTLATAAVATLLVGSLPAWWAARRRPADALAGVGRGGGSRARLRARRLVVAVEVALAVVLLVGAGLVARSLIRLAEVDPGYRTTGLIVANLTPGDVTYPDAAAVDALTRRLRESVATVAEIERVSVVADAPPSHIGVTTLDNVEVEGEPPPRAASGSGNSRSARFLSYGFVDSAYFRTMGIPIRLGRGFTPADDAAGGQVVVSAWLARRLWSDRLPIGRRFRLSEREPWLTVIGVAGDILQAGLSNDYDIAELYYPLTGNPTRPYGVAVIVQTAAPAVRIAPLVRARIREAAPDLPIVSVNTIETLLSESLARPRFTVALLGPFAVLAVLLTAIGVYGVVAGSVAERRREMAVRIALGAAPSRIGRQVVASGLRPVVTGLVAGVAAALALTHLIEGFLFEIAPTDPVTFALAAAVTGGMGLLASALPARRAAGADPAEALRAE